MVDSAAASSDTLQVSFEAGIALLAELKKSQTPRAFFDKRHEKAESSISISGFNAHRQLYGILEPDYLYISQILLTKNPLLIKGYSLERKMILRGALQEAFHLICMRYETEWVSDRRQNIARYEREMARCISLLAALDDDTSSQDAVFKDTIKLKSFFITQTLGDKILWINKDWRFFWVWLSAVFSSIYMLIQQQISIAILHPDNLSFAMQNSLPAQGLNWLQMILYPIRLAMHITLLLKHTLMPTTGEALILKSKTDRLKIEWKKRKFLVLNDILWTSVNAATFTGAPWPSLSDKTAIQFGVDPAWMLGVAGNVLTLLLLIGDTYLMVRRVQKEKSLYLEQTKHHAERLGKLVRGNNVISVEDSVLYQEKLTTLNQLTVLGFTETLLDCFSPKNELTRLLDEMKTLEEGILEKIKCIEDNKTKEWRAAFEQASMARDHLRLEWKYKEKELNYSVRYISVVVLSWLIYCNIFLAPLLFTSMAFVLGTSLSGGAFLLVGHMVLQYYMANIQIERATEYKNLKMSEADALWGRGSSEDYLEIKQCLIEAAHYEQLVRYHEYRQRRAMILSVSIVLSIFLGLLLIPNLYLGLIPLLVCGLAGVISHVVIESHYRQAPLKDAEALTEEQQEDTVKHQDLRETLLFHQHGPKREKNASLKPRSGKG